MNRHQRQWLPKGDPIFIRKLTLLWNIDFLLQPVGTLVPRGLRKYRSSEEAHEDRERWEQERVDRIRESRVRKP